MYDIERRADVFCPIQVHVHDSEVRERRRSDRIFKRKQTLRESAKRWIDLEDAVLDGYLYIDDKCPGPGIPPGEELPYPEGAIEAYDEQNDDEGDDDPNDDDLDSHGRTGYPIYNRYRSGPQRSDIDLSTTYPLANSHGNSYCEWSSHSKYADLRSEILARKYSKNSGENLSDFSAGTSHDSHNGIGSENRSRMHRGEPNSDQLSWDSRAHVNYEVANSHSNYRVYFDSHMQQEELLQATAWSPDQWRERFLSNFAPESSVAHMEDEAPKNDNATIKASIAKAKAEACQADEAACDLEQCLVQIEESLLNIEQNLLHVQDLDIPELRNLLYKSPSIERSLYEVQDLLFTDGMAPMIKRSKSLESDEEEDEEEEEEEDEDIWMQRNLTIKENDDDDGDNSGAGPPNGSNEESSDMVNRSGCEPSKSADGSSNTDCGNESSTPNDKTTSASFDRDTNRMNFVPNSLSKTLPRRIVLDETKDNIRLCSSQPEEHTIDYNLNCVYGEKKLFFRDKCHSRTASLDENSTFHNTTPIERQEPGKTSLQNLVLDSIDYCLDISEKAESSNNSGSPRRKSLQKKRSDENSSGLIELRPGDLHRKLVSLVPNRKVIATSSGSQKKSGTQESKSSTEQSTASRSREKSPTRVRRGEKSSQDKDTSGGKNFDKRKRKKLSSKAQGSSEGALVPNKLISLSLSLLVAALLQVVRCLTDLVEDAFRSVSYDRSSLLQ